MGDGRPSESGFKSAALLIDIVSESGMGLNSEQLVVINKKVALMRQLIIIFFTREKFPQ